MQERDAIRAEAEKLVTRGDATDLEDAVNQLVETKSDASPVTQADKKTSDFIIDRLKALTPDIPVLSEEAPETHADILQNHRTYWALDPIDGTRTFIDNIKGKDYDGFGIHLGLIDNGEPVYGVVLFPAQGENGVMYYTEGDKAYREELGKGRDVLRMHKPPLPDDCNLQCAHAYYSALGKVAGRDVDVIPEVGGGRILVAAAGKNFKNQRVDTAILDGPFSYWDVAASHACLIKAGGDMVDISATKGLQDSSVLQDAKPIRYTGTVPVIAPSVAAHNDTLALLGVNSKQLQTKSRVVCG